MVIPGQGGHPPAYQLQVVFFPSKLYTSLISHFFRTIEGRGMKKEGLSILITAENFFIHHFFSRLFEEQHFLKIAICGEKAVEELSRRPYDLVFINEYLPDMGMAELLDAMCKCRPEARSVVMLTHREDAGRLMTKYGVAGMLVKPFTVIDVFRLTERVLPAGHARRLFCLDALRRCPAVPADCR